MSAEKIQDALNLLPDDLLLETDALRQQKQRKPLVLKRLLPIAACFVLVVGALLVTMPLLDRKSTESAMDQMAAAEAPMEYGQPESENVYSTGKFPDRELEEPNAVVGQDNPARDEEKVTLDILLVAPPELVIRWDDQEVTVKSENYSWEYQDETGDRRLSAAGTARPMSEWKGDITLTTAAEALQLSWLMEPDAITVRCYSTARSSDTWNVEFPAELDGNILTLNPNCQIYEITATWDNNGYWGGEARYDICIMPEE